MSMNLHSTPLLRDSSTSAAGTSRGSFPRPRGFTLVELLVVIGIIAVLISILLPTLRGVRRQAAVVQCSSNMKQIATAMLMYIQDNKGKFPPCQVRAGGPGLPNGIWFPNELVRLNYIKGAPNAFADGPGTQKKVSNKSVFRCPEGHDADFKGGAGNYPTDLLNNSYQIANESQAQAEGFGIASWYMLNSRNLSASGAWPPTSSNAKVTPFLYFNGNGPQIDIDLKDPKWQRNLSMIRRGSEFVMLVESADTNWFDQTQGAPPYDNVWLKRLGARHGKKTKDGANAFTNLAFFDGHVGLYPSERFTRRTATGGNDNALVDQYQETIFFLNKQRGGW